jgi:hypothetical protein
MPFTPFHFGLGVLAKAAAPTRISFAGFAFSQVVMDLEPGIKMLTGSAADLHIITHNAIGATLIAFATLGLWRGWERYRPARYAQPVPGKSVLMLSCLFGTYSHVFLDGMYHRDMGLPQAQWAIAQASLAGLSGTEALCVGFLMAGAVIHGLRLLRSRLSVKIK